MNTGFILSFLAGITSILSPCVIPLIPVLVGHSILKRTNGELAAFILGFFLIFTLVTIITVVFTAAINYYLYYFRIVAALILVVVGLFFVVNKKFFTISRTSTEKKGILASFSLGTLTCLAWSPCFGPYVVAVAAYGASTGDIMYSALNMILFSAGFSLTLFLLALLTSRINFESLIKYSDWIRIISGIIITIAGLYMLIGLL